MANNITINLDNYKNLLNLARKDTQRAHDLIQGVLDLINSHYKDIEEATHMEAEKFLLETVLAFIDYEGIVANHPNEGEAKLMRLLKHENNPVRAMFDGEIDVYDVNGDRIKKREFFGSSSYKEWLQSLLYMGRYVSYKQLGEYLALNEFHLIDNIKNEHIEQLLSIQPALKYQELNGITVGKFKEGTGFFDCGESEIDTVCLACEDDRQIIKNEENLYCLACKAVFKMV